MKLPTLALALIILCSAFSSIKAYRWTMNNFTKKTFIVQVELLHSENAYFVLIPPKQSADFDWSVGNTMAGFCLGKIKYLIPNEQVWGKTDQENEIMLSRMSPEHRAFAQRIFEQEKLEKRNFYAPSKTGIDRDKMEITDSNQFLKWLNLNNIERQEVNLRFLKDELYDEMVSHVKQLSGTSTGANIVGWFADLIAQSKCRSRDISIVEEPSGEIALYTLAN